MTRQQAQESARKCLSGNRDLAQLMSRMTRNGIVPPIAEVLAAFDNIHKAGELAKGKDDAN